MTDKDFRSTLEAGYHVLQTVLTGDAKSSKWIMCTEYGRNFKQRTEQQCSASSLLVSSDKCFKSH
jgi:hypothetical protein